MIVMKHVSGVDELVLDSSSGMMHVIIRKQTKYGLVSKSKFIPIEAALIAGTIRDLLTEVHNND